MNHVRNYDDIDPKAVLRNLGNVLARCDMRLLSKQAYHLLELHCGYIAHYNHQGFIATYQDDMDSFVDQFLGKYNNWEHYIDNPKTFLFDVSYRGVLLNDIFKRLIELFQAYKHPVHEVMAVRRRERKLHAMRQLAEDLGYDVTEKR